MARMTFVFICQVVDQQDPIQATTVKWIEAYARHPQIEEVIVLALRTGEYSLPDNVTVYPIQGKNRLTTLIRFYYLVLQTILHKHIAFFFIHQGGPYPLLLLPLKLLLRKPVYQWKAHTYVSFGMQFYARYCDTKIFTSTPNAFPMKLSKIKVVGQGVDTEKFRIMPVPRSRELVTVGRISSVKRLDHILRVLDFCNRHYNTSYRLDIYGSSAIAKDIQYMQELETLTKELNLSHQVSFKGAVRQNEVPELLNQSRVFIHFCEGALSRAVVEAMACGLPVISTNVCVADILPQELRTLLIIPKDNLQQQAASLHALLSKNDKELFKIGTALRTIVTQNHSTDRLIEKILKEMTPIERGVN